jgi:hypothetical protein
LDVPRRENDGVTIAGDEVCETVAREKLEKSQVLSGW